MQLRLVSLALVMAAIMAQASPASACDPEGFDTPYDLHDRAASVALVKVISLGAGAATLSRVEALKGSLPATVTVAADLRSSCSSSLSAGARGVVFLDASGQMIGEYRGFERDKVVIATLRKYASATSARERAAALVDVAISSDWNRSFEAAFAIANRVPLILALDSAARGRVVKRLASVGDQHTLILVGARLRDASVRALQQRRKFEYGATLTAVLAGRYESESDTARLANAIAARGTSASDRVAAMDRCEIVHGITLARFTDYAGADASSGDRWSVRASACRSGNPAP